MSRLTKIWFQLKLLILMINILTEVDYCKFSDWTIFGFAPLSSCIYTWARYELGSMSILMSVSVGLSVCGSNKLTASRRSSSCKNNLSILKACLCLGYLKKLLNISNFVKVIRQDLLVRMGLEQLTPFLRPRCQGLIRSWSQDSSVGYDIIYLVNKWSEK